MEMNPQEQVIINNFNAHVLKLKDELRIVGEQLDSKLNLLQNTSKELEDISDKKYSLLEEISAYNKEYKEKIDRISTETKLLEEGKLQLSNDISKFEVYCKEEIIKLDNIRADKERGISELNNEIVSLSTKAKDLSLDNEKKNKSIDELNSEIITLSDSRNNINKEVLNLEENRDTIIKKIDKEIKEKNNELSLIKEEVELERQKIVMPLMALQERESVVEKRENNLEILFLRFKKEFKKMYPNLEPKI